MKNTIKLVSKEFTETEIEHTSADELEKKR